MSEALAEFLPTRLTDVEWRVSGIAVGNGGQGAGRVFLHTFLSRNKRVWRRTGPQPRDLDFDFKVLKIFVMNGYGSLRNQRNRRVSSRHTRHFSASGQKSAQKTPPQMSPATVVATSIPQPFPGRSHALRLTSRQSPGNNCSIPVETKGGWKSKTKTIR